ncbi:MAG: 4Fe-4S dicluster domain-containing protein [Desulfobacteraceae bacterium]|nr:MAG: 4Fe-4S dicluster domain-containing protein [Desulfobacteraceae bacterium]
MTLLTIDETKCKKDGLCVQECPAAVIRQRDKDSWPVMISRGVKDCLLCGHCVAVCPQGALHHEKIPMKDSPPVLEKLKINREQAVQFLRSRRSIRRFKTKPVERETIQFLIDTARYAPTGGNSQLVTWTVHTDEQKIKKIADLTIDWMRRAMESPGNAMASYMPMIIAGYEAGINTITHGAPCLIFASTPRRYENGMVDLSIALSYLELAAVSAGLGTCWLGLITRALKDFEPLKQVVGLPESHSHFYSIVLGHPKFKYHLLPERKPAAIFWK